MVGIIVVSYKNTMMTSRFVKEELSKLTTPYSLVIVNNESTQEECDELANKCGVDRSIVVCSKENLGYAKGNNLGVETLKNRGQFSHYLFANDDVEIKDVNILDVLCNIIDRMPQVAAIGPRVIGLDGRDQNPHNAYISPLHQVAWKLFPLFRKTRDLRVEKGHQDALVNGKTYWTSGAFMLVKAEYFDRIGGFDPETFLYFEEPILAEKFKKINKTFYYEPSQVIVHYEGGSSNDKTSQSKLKIEKQSRMLYYRKYKRENKIILWLYSLIC